MPDNVSLSSPTGTAATDERTIHSTTVQVPRVTEIANTAMANGQVTISNTAATIAAARETRKSLLVINQQTVAVWVGIATVTTSNGVRLDPGASLVLTTTALVQGITSAAYSSSGDATVQYVETYDS